MEPNGGKKRCIDDIIEHMTAEYGGFEGQYLLLGGQSGGGGSRSGGGSASGNSSGAPSRPSPLAPPSQPGRWPPPGVQQPQQPPQVYYPQQGELGMVDVGNGNYVVFSKPNPEFNQPVGFIHYQQPPQTLVQPHIIDCRQRPSFNEGMTNGCLIENVVGNWVPNRTGTYSPFGGTLSHDEPPLIQLPQQQHPPHQPQHLSSAPSSDFAPSLPTQIVAPSLQSSEKTQPNASTSTISSQPVKRHRIVAEVKPMRPSYSDVLAKSPPLTPPPSAKVPSNKSSTASGGKNASSLFGTVGSGDMVKTSGVKADGGGRKQQGKNSKNQGKNVSALKRQSSSGSDEALVEKVRASSGGNGVVNAAGSKWSSQEELLGASKSTRNCQQTPDLNKTKRDKRKAKIIKPRERVDLRERENFDVEDDDDDEDDDEYEGETNDKERSMEKPVERTTNSSKPKSRDEKKGPKSERGSLNSSGRSAKGKRNQRSGRRRDTYLGLLVKKWQEKSSLYIYLLTVWLWRLLYDVTVMSTSLLLHVFGEAWDKSVDRLAAIKTKYRNFCGKSDWRGGNAWWRRLWGGSGSSKKEKKFSKKSQGSGGGDSNSSSQLPGSLSHNITLPTTGEEAMKRLLSCKGKDPYSILGVTNTCTDEEIKRYYKSQALLVHPDKNSQPGAEEAFKILVHAFDLIAVPEKRAAYDRYVAETNQVEQAWSELSDLLSQLHEKMEYAANTIRCNNCGKRHSRQITERPSYAARFCAQCKIHHSAKEGDMWAESRGWGGWLGVRYYACMEGSVYDITRWANCQGNTMQKVKPDSHAVQYRVLMGRAPQNQPPPTEPDFEDLLNSLYSQGGTSSRNKKKSKKNK